MAEQSTRDAPMPELSVYLRLIIGAACKGRDGEVKGEARGEGKNKRGESKGRDRARE